MLERPARTGTSRNTGRTRNERRIDGFHRDDRDYFYCIGRLIYFFQCVEHDIKLIYCRMGASINDAEVKRVMEESPLGRSDNELQKLDNSDSNPYFTSRDYKLLKEVTKIRIHCAYNCFQEWVYETDVYRNALTKFARRMLNDHNRLAKLFRMVETIRIEICKDR